MLNLNIGDNPPLPDHDHRWKVGLPLKLVGVGSHYAGIYFFTSCPSPAKGWNTPFLLGRSVDVGTGNVLHSLSVSYAFLVLGYLFISKLWKNQRFVTRYCYFQETGLEKWKWCVLSKKFWWKLPFSSIAINCVFHEIIFNYSYQNRHKGYLGQQIDGRLNWRFLFTPPPSPSPSPPPPPPSPPPAPSSHCDASSPDSQIINFFPHQ